MKKIVIFPIMLLATVFIFSFLYLICPSANGDILPVVYKIREVSYRPYNYNWADFWANWNNGVKTQMDSDLDLLAGLNVNTIRIFINPNTQGFADGGGKFPDSGPSPEFLAAFNEALALISDHGLQAHVVLMDAFDVKGYLNTSSNVTRLIDKTKVWINAILVGHKDDSRIALLELINDFPVENSTAPIYTIKLLYWLQQVFKELKKSAGGIPCAVSTNNVEALNGINRVFPPPVEGEPPTNIFGLSWSTNRIVWTTPLPEILDRAYQIIGENGALILEFEGYDSYYTSEEVQADAYRDVIYYALRKGVWALGIGNLSDFQPGVMNYQSIPLVPTELYRGGFKAPPQPQQRKLSTEVLKRGFCHPAACCTDITPIYRTSLPLLRNTSLEIYADNKLVNWLAYGQEGSLQYFKDCTQRTKGNCSVKVMTQGTTGQAVGLTYAPSVRVLAGKPYSFKVDAKTTPATGPDKGGGAKLRIDWFDKNGQPLQDIPYSEGSIQKDLTSWNNIELGGIVPVGAVHALLSLLAVDTKDDGIQAAVWFDNISFSPMVDDLPVEKGWNMVSLSLDVSLDGNGKNIDLIFPTRKSPVWAYSSSGYVRADDPLVPGVGYWVKFDSDQIISIAGNPLAFQSIPVRRGWNMIGSVSYPAAVKALDSQPSGIIDSSTIYTYKRRSYIHTLTDGEISPGLGYWVKFGEEGSLIFSGGEGEVPTIDFNGLNQLTLVDKNNSYQTLFYGYRNQSIPEDWVEMPPAQEGNFDVRFMPLSPSGSNGFFAKLFTAVGTSDIYPIQISSAVFPIKLFISVDASQTNKYGAWLTYIAAGKEKKIPLKPGKVAIKIKENASGFALKLVNDPPKLGTLSNKKIKANSTGKFKVSATDKNKDTITIAASIPDGMGAIFNPGNSQPGKTEGEFVFSPASAQIGQVYTVTFTATDSVGQSDSKSITITVKQ